MILRNRKKKVKKYPQDSYDHLELSAMLICRMGCQDRPQSRGHFVFCFLRENKNIISIKNFNYTSVLKEFRDSEKKKEVWNMDTPINLGPYNGD